VGLVRQVLRTVAGQAMHRPVRMSALAVGAAGLGAVAGLVFVSGSGVAAHPAVLTPYMVTGPVRMTGVAPWSALTVNGKLASDANGQAGEPWVNVAPGEKVTFEVTVTVPANDRLSAFLLGVTPSGGSSGTGASGTGAAGTSSGIRTVLATAAQLAPGTHRITAHWTVPPASAVSQPGYELDAAAYWPRGTTNEPAAEEAPIASLIVTAS
jgi:hypothetical protein